FYDHDEIFNDGYSHRFAKRQRSLKSGFDSAQPPSAFPERSRRDIGETMYSLNDYNKLATKWRYSIAQYP
ncbi:hypothetical protein WDW89_04685, partial [Deltaproteobacteria bacterium TL4]